MPTDILKRPIKHCVLMDFLSKISSLHKNEYFVTYDSFKRAKYNNNELIHVFLIKYDHITTSRKEHILTKLQSRTDDFSLFYDRYVTIIIFHIDLG